MCSGSYLFDCTIEAPYEAPPLIVVIVGYTTTHEQHTTEERQAVQHTSAVSAIDTRSR